MSFRPLPLVLLVLVVSPVLQAQQSFEAVVAGHFSMCGIITAPNTPVIRWINPDREYFGLDRPYAVASADGRRVFGLLEGDTSFRIVEVFPDGTEAPFVSIAGFGSQITQAPNGRIFVTAMQGPNWVLVVVSAAGAVEAVHPIPTPGNVDALAVASDGCTIYYTQQGSIRRMNGCTGAGLSPFAAVNAYDIFPLANGQVLVGTDDDVVLYDAGGSVLRTIPLAAYGLSPDLEAGQVALSPDLQTLWIAALPGCDFGAEGQLLRVSFSTGAELTRQPLALHFGYSLVLGLAAADVPLAGTTVLLFFALTIAGAGAFILGRS